MKECAEYVLVWVVNEAKHKLLHGSVMAPLANRRDELCLDIGSPDSLVLAKAAVSLPNRADKLQLNSQPFK